MLYELRIYHANPGKLAETHARFENHAMRLFPKYGIKVIDYWKAADDKESLYYICEWPDMETRDKAWEAFTPDPEWQAARNESHKNGILVNRADIYFMERIPLPLKPQ